MGGKQLCCHLGSQVLSGCSSTHRERLFSTMQYDQEKLNIQNIFWRDFHWIEWVEMKCMLELNHCMAKLLKRQIEVYLLKASCWGVAVLRSRWPAHWSASISTAHKSLDTMFSKKTWPSIDSQWRATFSLNEPTIFCSLEGNLLLHYSSLEDDMVITFKITSHQNILNNFFQVSYFQMLQRFIELGQSI